MIGKRFWIVMMALVIGVINGNAQKYNSAGGLRFGNDFGIAFAQRIGDKTTIQAIYEDGVWSDRRNLMLHAASHKPLLSKRFNFYLGGGLFIAGNKAIANSKTAFGPSGTFGGELTIGRLILSADWSPQISVVPNTKRFVTNSGIGLKYVLVKRPKKVATWKEKWRERLKINKKNK